MGLFQAQMIILYIFLSNFNNQINPDLYYYNFSNNEIVQLTKTNWEEWRPIMYNKKYLFYIK